MSRLGGRLALAIAIGGLSAAPLLLPYLSILVDASALSVWQESDRIFTLAGHTCGLVATTLAFVMPIGIVLAFLLHASSTRWQRATRMLFAIGLVAPLPVTTVAWHALKLGQWSPFAQGLVPAAVLHALASLPWVVLIVEAGLASRDSAVNDDACLHAGPFVRAMRVTFPGIRGFVALAALWVCSQTAGEIVITDLLQTRTFAEEVYTQAVAPGTETGTAAETAVARAVAASLPLPLTLGLGFILAMRLLRRQPMHSIQETEASSNTRASAIVMVLGLVSVAMPTLNLSLRCCATPASYSCLEGCSRLVLASRENAWLITDSVLAAIITGVCVSLLVGIVAWLSIRRSCFRVAMFGVAALAAAVPGPIVGLGVRAAIDLLLTTEQRELGTNWLRGILYDGPSLLPVAWVWAIRAWPLAYAIWWPAITRLPRHFGEATRMDTGSLFAMLRYDALPTLWRPFIAASGLVTAFALGEVSGSRLVATPGGQSFAHDVFARMHFGITPELAAMCLVLMVVVVACLASFCVVRRLAH